MKVLDSPASRNQVNDGDNQCDHKQEVNQAAGHVESPAQKPKDNEDCKNRPKHRYTFEESSQITTKGEKRCLQPELSLEICFPEGRTYDHGKGGAFPAAIWMHSSRMRAGTGKDFSALKAPRLLN